MTEHTATYSPEDNKLRMYPACRLNKEEYNRMRGAGFKWAPRQELFVAPKWTPGREDLLLEFCGEIGDEDTSLVDRAEMRAERFEEYSSKRETEACSAKATVDEITGNIPFGQPILVGHHSEKRARKDAERIENGMRKAVKLWETSQYWKDRAAGAIHAAKYKELPAVRARRIKKIEAEIRKMIASYTPKNPNETINQVPWLCPVCRKYSCKEHPEALQKVPHVWVGHSRGGSWEVVSRLPSIKKYYSRWIAHCENRLIYEKTMLNEQGAGGLLKPKARPKQPPLLNYRAPDGLEIENIYHRGEFSTYPQIEMTKAEYKAAYSKGTHLVDGSHRVRAVYKSRPGNYKRYVVFLTDSKIHKRPEKPEQKQETFDEQTERHEQKAPKQTEPLRAYTPPERTEFDDMKDTLRQGIKTVSAPQLFPTPPEIARKMVEFAELKPGECVLEPSAGSGNIVNEIINEVDTEILCYEINHTLAGILEKRFPSYKATVKREDFLKSTFHQGEYPRIIMNPPFDRGLDIKHIKHALTFLKPGGKLVALCANGPRQQAAFKDIATHWEDLPAGSFKQAGTNVNVALMVIDN